MNVKNILQQTLSDTENHFFLLVSPRKKINYNSVALCEETSFHYVLTAHQLSPGDSREDVECYFNMAHGDTERQLSCILKVSVAIFLLHSKVIKLDSKEE